MPQLPPAIPLKRVVQSLREIIAATTEGNVAAFSRNLGLPKTTLWELVQGYFPPSLPFLLQLCYQFRLSPLRLLSSGEHAAPAESPVPLEQTQKRDAHRSFNREKVRQALEDILAAQQSAPLSMRGAARQLGYPVRTIKTHFPVYCREISRRYAEYRKQQGQLRKARLRQRIYETARILHSQKLTLTYQRVGTLLNAPGCFREREARCALLDIRSQLEEEAAGEHAAEREEEFRRS